MSCERTESLTGVSTVVLGVLSQYVIKTVATFSFCKAAKASKIITTLNDTM